MGLERKAVLRAAPAHTVHYERRRPEETILHGLVREHLETFLAQAEARTGTGLPAFVRDEFEAFLECGILAHGILRLRCADCAHEKLVAFSCKRRGFCPSCGARRMAESAAHLVDEVIPRVPVRQWVLSFPIPLRILFAAHPGLLTPVLRVIHRVIAGFLETQRHCAVRRCARLQPACRGALRRASAQRNSNACAATSPVRRSRTNGSAAMTKAKSCFSSGALGATAPRTS